MERFVVNLFENPAIIFDGTKNKASTVRLKVDRVLITLLLQCHMY